MKKYLLFALLIVVFQKFSFSAAGDTTIIRSHNGTHLNWYGNFFTKTKFPEIDSNYKQILLKFTIGCPSGGCSDWDYTTKVFARRKIGIDTVIVKTPNYKLGAQNFDSIIYKTSPTYVTFFSAQAGGTDSTISMQQKIYSFLDTTNRALKTDSINIYIAGYWNYYFNTSGVKIDSIYVSGIKLIQTYFSKTNYNNKYEFIEFARYITPYAGDRNFGFFREFTTDITDYRSVLTDSVEIGVKYEGYSDGFTVSLDYIFIKGEPIREAYKVVPLYYGGFEYGNPNNSIEKYIKEVKLAVDSSTAEMGVIVLQTGHGFGGNENCAEFCEKYHYLKINGVQRFSSAIWKNDCGMNPLYPQPGTWLYDRANWCPGEMVRPIYYDISQYINAGDSLRLDLDMQPFINQGNNSCSYNIATNVIFYRDRQSNFDLELQEIISPSADWQNSRFNPTCGKPIVKVRNNGIDISGFVIEYGMSNSSSLQQYNYNGNLAMNESVVIDLDPLLIQAGGDFIARVKTQGVLVDYNLTNNEKSVKVIKTSSLPNEFFIEFRTNNAANENEYELTNLDNSFWHYKSVFKNVTTHRDTVRLQKGCYTFLFRDFDKDGLSFFANNDGSGYVRFKNMSGTTIQTFRADFGTEIRFQFTVDSVLTGIENVQSSRDLGIQVFPNPSSTYCVIESISNNAIQKITIRSIDGKICHEIGQFSDPYRVELNTEQFDSGLYIFEIESTKGISREKVEIIR